MKVIPPNFGYVEEGIFRCGAPEPRHHGFLASLGLRTCILLTDTHDGAFVHWLQESGVIIFCPLSSEAQTRSTFRSGGPPASAPYSPTEGVGYAQPRNNTNSNTKLISGNGAGGGLATSSGSGGYQNTAMGLGRDDGRDEMASPNSGDPYGSGIGSKGNTTVAAAGAGVGGAVFFDGPDTNDGLGGGDGGAGGGFDNSGNYGNEGEALAGGAGGGGRGGGAGGWQGNNHLSATTNGNSNANSGTSNAVRFLQENANERQITTKFSPVLIQEPLYFPAESMRAAGAGGTGVGGVGGGISGGGSGGGIGPYQFVSAPSYESRLHGLMTLSEAVVVSILHIMLDPHYYPLLITCSKGRYRSGIVCGCLRKLQGWNLVSILEEYRRFAGNKSRADNEEFIELFDEELVNLELADGRRPTILYNL